MQPRHRPRFNIPRNTGAHHQVIALIQQRDETGYKREIVGPIRVPHDNVFALGLLKPLHVGVAITALGLVHNPRAKTGGNLCRTVVGHVIYDYHFTPNTGAGKPLLGLLYTGGDALLFVEAGHYHRDFGLFGLTAVVMFLRGFNRRTSHSFCFSR